MVSYNNSRLNAALELQLCVRKCFSMGFTVIMEILWTFDVLNFYEGSNLDINFMVWDF